MGNTSQNQKKLKDWFTAAEASQLSGLTFDMVNYLCRHDLVSPSKGSKRGRGTRRRYGFTDIILLRVISKLLQNGVSPLRLKDNLTALKGRGVKANELLTTRFVVTDGFNIYFKDDGVIELLSSGQMAFAFVLELSKLREEVTANINELKIA